MSLQNIKANLNNIAVIAALRTDPKSRYWESCIAYLHVLLRNRFPSLSQEQREDAVQEATFLIYRHIAAFRGDSKFTTWISTVAFNCTFDMLRKNRPTSQEISDALFDIENTDEYANVERLVVHRESAGELNSHVRKLPPHMQTIVRSQIDGYSTQEIAKQLGVSPVTVRVSMMRARRLLRAMIIDENTQQAFEENQKNDISPSEILPSIISSIVQLPEPYKMVVALRVIRHMSYNQIAKQLHRSVSTVKSQYHRGEKKLQAFNSTVHQEPIEIPLEMLAHTHKLRKNLQEVITLHHVQHLSHAEIARRMDRPEGTIKGWLNRARKQLQQYTVPSPMNNTKRTTQRKRVPLSQNAFEYIRKMHSVYRMPMTYYYQDNLDISLIAQLLGKSCASVRSTINRGRGDLKRAGIYGQN